MRQHGQPGVGGHGQSGPQSQLVITITSFRQAQVGIRVAGGERSFEIGQLSVERIELGTCSGQGDSLRGDQWAEVARHQVALAGQAQVGKLTGDRQVEPELTQAHHQLESTEIVGRVLAIPIRLPRRPGKDAASLVEPDG